MRDEEIRALIHAAVDRQIPVAEPSEQRKNALYAYAIGGKPMNKRIRISMGLALAIVLTMLAIGAMAAALLSARQVIEQSAVPMALENDTENRIIESYTHDQLVTLIQTANENGITLSESTGITRALQAWEGYWEDEAIMDLCRAAFGGLYSDWTYEEQYWYNSLMAEMYGYENEMDYPGPGDLTAEEARARAADALRAAYPDAAKIEDPALYLRREQFMRTDTGSLWMLQYQPLNLTHPAYAVTVDQTGNAQEMKETPQDWREYTPSTLENAVSAAYRASTATRSSWSQEAWHAFRDKLPGASRESGWRLEHDAFLQTEYPLPEETDLPPRDAVAIAQRDAGVDIASDTACVLVSDGTSRVWRVTLRYTDAQGTGQPCSWEIDSRTGDILRRDIWRLGDRNWQAYVPQSVYDAVTKDLLTGDEAVALVSAALRRELQDDTIPFDDPTFFQTQASYSEWANRWEVLFRTQTLRYGTCAGQVDEKGNVTLTNVTAPQVDGDSLYSRYRQVYPRNPWPQALWVQFGNDMKQYDPVTWQGQLLKSTAYPEEETVTLTREQAVDIAFAHNDWQREEPLDATLIGAEPNPVWKIVLSGQTCIWLYEIDAETGEILDREAYAPDNSDFDNPLKRYTLHRDYAPAYVAQFGAERLAEIEVIKAYGDMTFDEPALPGAEMDAENPAQYATTLEDHTVLIWALTKGFHSYRVTFTDGWMTEKIEVIQ